MALVLVVLCVGSDAQAQSVWAQRDVSDRYHPVSPDRQLLHRINTLEGQPWSAWLGTVDHLAYPLMVGTVPAWWAYRLAEGDRAYSDVWRATVAWASSYSVMAVLKNAVRRKRPFAADPAVVRRMQYPGARAIDRYAFPSGHALITAAVATSFALSAGSWKAAAPAAVWVVSVGVSRIWLGVHYPSDVLAGWILGAAIGWGIHELGDTITPTGLRGRTDTPVLHLTLSI